MNNKRIRRLLLSLIRVVTFLLILVLLPTACQFPKFMQKPPCGESTLKLGETIYRIKETKTKSDGYIKVPSNKSGIAYWVNQTEINHVFALSPTKENLVLQNASPEQAILTWDNCNSSTYVLSAPQPGVPATKIILDQSFSGITILVQDGSNGFYIRGEFIGEEIQTFNTPDPSAVLAEVSLFETTTSADKTTISVKVSIANMGTSIIKVTATDVVLLLENAPALTPTGSDPVLPKQIAAGVTETFTFTFARPDVSNTTLRIFDVEYDLEGY